MKIAVISPDVPKNIKGIDVYKRQKKISTSDYLHLDVRCV